MDPVAERMDDGVDELYTAIKLYLTQVPRGALDQRESRRWTDIISFTINMEQIGDIIERVIYNAVLPGVSLNLGKRAGIFRALPSTSIRRTLPGHAAMPDPHGQEWPDG